MKNRRILLLLPLFLMAAAVAWGQSVQSCRRALVFGLGEQMDVSWGKINGDKDVAYVVEMLHGVGFTDIVTLVNSQATKAAMVAAFEELAGRCHKGDIVYIHYSGHGQLMTDINGDEQFKWSGNHAQWDEAWIPYDAYMQYGANDKGEKHLCDDEGATLLLGIRRKIGNSGELMVVVDACHSGDATCGEMPPQRGIDVKFNIPRKANEPVDEPADEQWLTVSACKPFQVNVEMGTPKVGKLTYALYTLGYAVLENDAVRLQELLQKFMQENRGPLPQNPVVSGSKKML